MHDGHWNDGMGNGGWWWIPMMIMMIAFWGGLIWLGVSLLRRNNTPSNSAVTTQAPTAEGILGERLARGEIEADEYHKRLAALRTPPNT